MMMSPPLFFGSGRVYCTRAGRNSMSSEDGHIRAQLPLILNSRVVNKLPIISKLIPVSL